MPRPRFNNLPADKRQRILGAAALEFASRGFEQASLNRLIDAAGISKGATYYYFDDKADLYATIINEGWRTLLPERGLDPAQLDRRNFWRTLRGLYREMLAAAEQQPWLVSVGKLVYGPPPSPKLGNVVAEEFAQVMAYLSGLIARGQEVGAIRADVPAPFLVAIVGSAFEAADRWSVDHAEELGAEGMDRLGVTLFEMIERFVEPPRTRGAR